MKNPNPLTQSYRTHKFSSFAIAALCGVSLMLCRSAEAVLGAPVPDRATLNAILSGLGPVTETFEGLPVPPGNAIVTIPTINNSTPVLGFGSGLVLPGVTYNSPAALIQWNGAGYYGLPSRDLLSNSTMLGIDFDTPTVAFGLDLLVYAGYSDGAIINVYGADDTTLLANISGIFITDPSSPVFFGYQYSGGIGRVTIEDTQWGWSPLIDNLTFVPEPSAGALCVFGFLLVLACRARVNTIASAKLATQRLK
jgi:hypothetical protein